MLFTKALNNDNLIRSPDFVMPDLISLPRQVLSRGHPEGGEFTGFRLPDRVRGARPCKILCPEKGTISQTVMATSKDVSQWTLTTLREKLIKIGAKVVRHAKYVFFHMAEVAVPRKLFAAILDRFQRLRTVPGMAPS